MFYFQQSKKNKKVNRIRQFYKKTTCTDWQIAFADNTLEDIVDGSPLKLHVMEHDYKDRWFADPFILDVTDTEILLLVECVTDDTRRGRIALLNVDKESYKLKNMFYVLDLPTHLSFPVIVRHNGHVYVYPESGESGSLDIYEFDSSKKSLVFQETIMDKALGDAIISDEFGDLYMFATENPDMNGRCLSIYRRNADKSWTLDEKVLFDDYVARMAGEFFKVGNKIYRPAQECNESYGHGLVIQEVISPRESEDMKWHFREVCRMTSSLKRYPLCLHTLNAYKNVVVMDVKGYRYKTTGKFLQSIKSLLLGHHPLEHTD